MRREGDIVADAHQPASQTGDRTVGVQAVEVVTSLFPVLGAITDDVIGNY